MRGNNSPSGRKNISILGEIKMATFEELEKADPSHLLSTHQLAEAYYKSTDGLYQIVDEDIMPILAGLLKPTQKEQAILGTFYRMFGWMYSLKQMDNPKDFQGIAAAARSLFELLLDIKILAEDQTGDAVAKFYAFP